MSVYFLYFSPTGGTKKVMDILNGVLKAGQAIDLSIPDADYGQFKFTKDDVCLIGVPSFGGRVPDVVLEHMKTIQAEQTPAVIVSVFGNRDYDDTLLELKEAAKNCGFTVFAAVAAVAEHSIMREYGAGRPDEEDRKELEQFANHIQERLMSADLLKDVEVPGKFPYREYHGVPFKPTAGKKCTGCGLCVRLCPVQAIPAGNPASVDEKKCISCMRCINVCPENARGVNKLLLMGATKKMQKVCGSRKKNELFI